MTATLLGSPRAVFLTPNGGPLSGGLVHTYVPGGTTPATTWQDAAQSIPNANPIVLDAAGSCLLYGAGSYQLTVTDSLGNAVPGCSGVTTSTTLNAISAAMAPVVGATTLSNAMVALGISLALQPVVAAGSTAAALTALGVPTAVQPVVTNATLSGALNALMAGGIISSAPAVSFGPVGNAFTTLGNVVQQATTTSTNLREFAGSFGLESRTGFGGQTGGINADKVALYAGIEGFANSANIWALNSVTNLTNTFPATGQALGYELDYNNNARNTGATDGLAGFAAPLAIGLLVSGNSSFGSTAAISVQGASNTQWHRGLGVASGVSDVAFYDYSTSTIGIEMQATHAGWGIDMNGSSLGGAIRVPNNTGIFARNNAVNADIAIATVDGLNNLVLGVTPGAGNRANGVFIGNTLFPSIDNTYQCGATTNRFTSLWAVNGTVQTSDPSLKTDIADLPAALPIVAAITPKTFRWKDGGADMIDGQPVPRAGKRTHWGFLAPDVKAAMDGAGRDFGGYVKSPDGVESLRPDQLIPVLWKACQELAAKVAALEAKKAA